jgi:hypothetical protein
MDVVVSQFLSQLVVTAIEPGNLQLQVFDSDPIIPWLELKRVLVIAAGR